uniref:Putative secreted protein n=1 Tax=Anopheles darlingi TaxID=43151 RepID=A0A2M4DN77_ANODA
MMHLALALFGNPVQSQRPFVSIPLFTWLLVRCRSGHTIHLLPKTITHRYPLLLRTLERLDDAGSEQLLVQHVRTDMASIEVADLGTGPNVLQARAPFPRNVCIIFGANRNDERRVVGNGEVLQVRTLVHHTAHELEGLPFPPALLGSVDRYAFLALTRR